MAVKHLNIVPSDEVPLRGQIHEITTKLSGATAVLDLVWDHLVHALDDDSSFACDAVLLASREVSSANEALKQIRGD